MGVQISFQDHDFNSFRCIPCTCNGVDEPRAHYTKLNKPDKRKTNTVWCYLHVKQTNKKFQFYRNRK